jgi:hypothetical protein
VWKDGEPGRKEIDNDTMVPLSGAVAVPCHMPSIEDEIAACTD